MLTAELIKKIKKIHIKSGRVVNTLMAGQYRSVFRGAGIEFEEVREYAPGDEVKNIDWKVSARMGRPFIKRYREEREQILMLLIDMSASATFGTRATLKQETAAELAAILAFNATRNNDKVGAILFTDRVEKYIPPQKGSGHVWRLIRAIFAFEAQGRKTDIGQALQYFGSVYRKKTFAFLISDFLDSDYIRGLKIAARKHELIGVLLSDPGEFTLPRAGLVTVRDLESGQLMLLDASDAGTRREYEAYKQGGYRATMNLLESADIDCLEVRTDVDVADALSRYFRRREKRMH